MNKLGLRILALSLALHCGISSVSGATVKPVDKRRGMSTFEKVAIGAGVVALLGGLVYVCVEVFGGGDDQPEDMSDSLTSRDKIFLNKFVNYLGGLPNFRDYLKWSKAQEKVRNNADLLNKINALDMIITKLYHKEPVLDEDWKGLVETFSCKGNETKVKKLENDFGCFFFTYMHSVYSGYYDYFHKNIKNEKSGSETVIKNGNLSNIKNLCYWHSFLQQMFSLKSFRKFIDEVDLDSLENKSKAKDVSTADKIRALRILFGAMSTKTKVDLDTCKFFASMLLPAGVYGRQNDLNEILPNFMSDVFEEFEKFCTERYKLSSEPGKNSSNIPSGVVNLESTLQDLLNSQEGCLAEKQAAVRELLECEEYNQIIFKNYLEKLCGVDVKDIPEVVNTESLEKVSVNSKYAEAFELLKKMITNECDDSTKTKFLNFVLNDLADGTVLCIEQAVRFVQLTHQIDVSVIEGQFVIFVNRTSYKSSGAVKNEDLINFGTGIVQYGDKQYTLTSVSVQHGGAGGGHYYTYKKEKDGNWYKYNDCSDSVPQVTWEEVKKDAQCNCTMMTFSEDSADDK